MGGHDRDSWLIATIVMTALSSAVFTIQRFVTQVFNYPFEVCVFYVPTIASLIIYLWERTTSRRVS